MKIEEDEIISPYSSRHTMNKLLQKEMTGSQVLGIRHQAKYEAAVNIGAIQGVHSYVHQPGERLQERGDKEKDNIICALDHLYAFCNYIAKLKSRSNVSFMVFVSASCL
ncbi:hypothetical protein RMATCC62417_17408 [Rhizopus microsporus]|nr:hypothetical protein RMATCC62417_17408 [Rhizopus microsporus]